MSYQISSNLIITCDGPGCRGSNFGGKTGPRAAIIELPLDDTFREEQTERIVQRALARMPNSDWLLLIDFNATSRTELQFFCSATCLMRGADLPPPRRGTGIYTGSPRETRPTTPPPYPRDV